ncbi:hypothetical protein SNE40_008914 [Patella caerulea]|uniref:Uncharacterized protein n=1 Tax=Patella caerulea TaxID=87958 RepID=A0AAN8JR69_PATCE
MKDEEDDENIKVLLQSETLLSVSEDYNSQRFPAHEDKLTYLPNNRVPDKIMKDESLYPTDDVLKEEFLYPTDENIHLRYKRDDTFSSGGMYFVYF